ncbi:4-hydroxyphenylacetate decarboxylase large subunit [Serratia fonticola]|uniref:4-hydroxyphenylacetate decarboxylase large subunit n=1 Tax=Serratia fonticola TaxID=47917 RepID=A0A4V6KM04_SERFO|nr:4-hydroxyphenylacetate decarboxylase large subunit [Serratia fonticola]
MPLSDGISPTQGADKQGPTAIIKSVSKMNVETMNIGMVHNFKFLKGLLDTPEGKNGLITLLRTASILGNGQMQFSYVDNEVLKQRRWNQRKYRDLIVRVAVTAPTSSSYAKKCRTKSSAVPLLRSSDFSLG